MVEILGRLSVIEQIAAKAEKREKEKTILCGKGNADGKSAADASTCGEGLVPTGEGETNPPIRH